MKKLRNERTTYLQVAIIGLAVFQLNQHGMVLCSTEKGEGKLYNL